MSQSDEFKASLIKYLPEFDLSLSDNQIELCLRHYELMRKWNRSINLSRITEPDEAARFHYCESMFADRFLPDNLGIADLGSGAGFPGVPLSILKPERVIKLIDSNSKKAVFLKEAVRALNLVNVEVLSNDFQNIDLTNLTWVTRAVEQLEFKVSEMYANPQPKSIVIFSANSLREKLNQQYNWDIRFVPIPLSKGRLLAISERNRGS